MYDWRDITRLPVTIEGASYEDDIALLGRVEIMAAGNTTTPHEQFTP